MTTPSVPSIPELAERLREHAKRVYTDDLSFPVMTPRRLIIEAADALDSDATPDGEWRVVWWEARGQWTSDRDLGNETFTEWRPLPSPPGDR